MFQSLGSPHAWFLLSGLAGTTFMVYGSVLLVSSVKFLIALIGAAANPQFGFWEVALLPASGAIAGVFVYTYFGQRIQEWFRSTFTRAKPADFRKQRRTYRLWHRYGLIGVSFLNVIISPMISVGIAVSFNEKPSRILFWNCLSIVFWSFVMASFREVVTDWLAGR